MTLSIFRGRGSLEKHTASQCPSSFEKSRKFARSSSFTCVLLFISINNVERSTYARVL